MMNNRNQTRLNRAKRSRTKMFGTKDRPRLVIYKSLTSIEAQAINDTESKSLFGFTTKAKALAGKKSDEKIKWLADKISEACKKNNIKTIIFDRSGYPYSGNILKLAEAIRSKGIEI